MTTNAEQNQWCAECGGTENLIRERDTEICTACKAAVETITEPTTEQYAKLGRYVAALMGANEEWDSAADYLEDIAFIGSHVLGVSVGDPGDDELKFWRTLADKLGIEHDGEDDEEDEDEE